MRSQVHSSSRSLALSYDSLKSLGSQVVAYHICQADHNRTCMVAEFVHSLAGYLCSAPQLRAYRDLLLDDVQLQSLLALKQCIQDPSRALVKAILEPLIELWRLGKISAEMCVILVDSLNEAEFHKPDYGDTIASFLTKHVMKFPSWLKLIVTVRSSLQDLTKFLPFHRINVDKYNVKEHVHRDLQEYITYRVNHSPHIRRNIVIEGALEATSQHKFTQHVLSLSRGCFLYCKLLLDLIEKGHLVLKSSNYKILPVNLSEVYLLLFNLKFPTIRSFEKVGPLLNVCLASLYPLTAREIYLAVNAGYTQRYVSWPEFESRLSVMSNFVLLRQDGTYQYFHPAFREWLLRREEHESAKFLCDLRSELTTFISSFA